MTPRFAIVVGAAAVGIAAALVFTRLGDYPFWGDEADTVIFARGVWETGDTRAWYGDNLYAYRNGALLDGYVNRATPPAAYYLAAPFWGLAGADRLLMRLPFALGGLATLALVLRWAYVRRASSATFGLLAAALALNVSFVLYSRQCRYYSLGMLLTVVVAYLYDRYDGDRRRLWGLVAALCLLAATHYLNFAAVAAALVVDYAVRGKSRPKLSPGDWAILVVPTALVVAVLAWAYNPLDKHDLPNPDSQGFVADKLKLLWWSLRDMNRCEYGALVVLAAAPLVAGLRRDAGLARLFVACATFVVVTTLLSPQPVHKEDDADVRYLAPIVEPCIALTVLTFAAVAGRRPWWAAAPVVLLATTNFLHVPWDHDAWRSTLGEYLHELREPRRTATAELADWLATNVAAGTPVGMIPTDWLASSIVAAPHVHYGWQFDADRKTGPYADLPDVLFIGRAPVDVLIVMGFKDTEGKVRRELLPTLAQQGWNYQLDAVLDVYFDDRTRPELIWHWFRDRPYDKSVHPVYLYRRTP